MFIRHYSLSFCAALLCSLLLTAPASAGELVVTATVQDHILLLEPAQPGTLARQLPTVDTAALVERLQALRTDLIERKAMLLQLAEQQKLDAGDALITAIMPGGLLFAGYRKVRLEQTRSELATVNTEIDEIGRDLQAFQFRTGQLVVAKRQ